jgi:hypothetical protein
MGGVDGPITDTMEAPEGAPMHTLNQLDSPAASLFFDEPADLGLSVGVC